MYMGLHHALLIRDVANKASSAVLAMAIGIFSYLTGNPTLGLLCGLSAKFLIEILKSRQDGGRRADPAPIHPGPQLYE